MTCEKSLSRFPTFQNIDFKSIRKQKNNICLFMGY